MTKRNAHAPGKSHRDGMSLKGPFRMFPDNAASGQWFREQIRNGTPFCPHCGSTNVNLKVNHVRMPHQCRGKGCCKFFSMKTGTVMEASNISYWDWAIANYLYRTSLKGISFMRPHS